MDLHAEVCADVLAFAGASKLYVRVRQTISFLRCVIAVPTELPSSVVFPVDPCPPGRLIRDPRVGVGSGGSNVSPVDVHGVIFPLMYTASSSRRLFLLRLMAATYG